MVELKVRPGGNKFNESVRYVVFLLLFFREVGEGSVAVRSTKNKDNYEESKLHTIASQEKSC